MNKILLSEEFWTTTLNIWFQILCQNYRELRKLCKNRKFDFLIHFFSNKPLMLKNLKNINSFDEILKFKSFKKLLFISTDGVTKLINKKILISALCHF